MKRLSQLVVTGLCAGLMSVGMLAHAQQYPSKSIRVISPSGAGGPVDVICRTVMAGLSKELGQQIVVENRVGAAGLIGTDYVSKQAPDGYTLLFGFSGPLAIVPNLNPKTPYNPTTDLAPVSQVAAAPYVLLVHPSVPAKSVKELVALARSRPGQLNFGSGGIGVGIHMAGELFKLAAKVDIVHVPFQGAAPAMTALISGEVDMMFNGMPPALPHIRAGRVRALAVGGENRSGLLPDLPTVLESGFDFNTEGWYGVVAPRGTPAAIVNTLHKALVTTMASEQIRAQMKKLAVESSATSPAEFAQKIREENVRWAEVIKAAGIKVTR
jgi:tripartite-type tricarboxylate transporter receptor subunit TctC